MYRGKRLTIFGENRKAGRNYIEFGSAPRREADSQPISPLSRPAVSHTEPHSLSFLSVADAGGPKQWGDFTLQGKQWPNGNAANPRPFGRRFKPRIHGAAAAAESPLARIRTAERTLCIGCITIRPAVV